MSGETGMPFQGTLEQGFISTLMNSHHRFADMQAIGVSAEWFTEPLCQKVWQAMELLHEANRMFSYIDIREVLHMATGEAPLLSAIFELDQWGREEAFLVGWARMLRVRVAKVQVAGVFADASSNGHPETPDQYAERLSHFAGRLTEIANDTAMNESLDQRALVSRAVDEADEAAMAPPGIQTGIEKLDSGLGGMRPGEMFVVGARPGIGKSSFACTVTDNVMLRDPDSVVFYASVEMRVEEVYKRLIGIRARVSPLAIENGTATDEEIARWRNASSEWRARPAQVEYRGMQSVTSVVASATRLHHRRARLDLVIVDGLHAMRAKAENRTNEITKLSGALREMAATLGVPVLVCAQLNRGMDARDNKMPGLSDLRDSGALEQDADVVMFIHRPGANPNARAETKDQPPPHPSETHLVIAKHRRGKTGVVRIVFHEELTRFASPEAQRGIFQ